MALKITDIIVKDRKESIRVNNCFFYCNSTLLPILLSYKHSYNIQYHLEKEKIIRLFFCLKGIRRLLDASPIFGTYWRCLTSFLLRKSTNQKTMPLIKLKRTQILEDILENHNKFLMAKRIQTFFLLLICFLASAYCGAWIDWNNQAKQPGFVPSNPPYATASVPTYSASWIRYKDTPKANLTTVANQYSYVLNISSTTLVFCSARSYLVIDPLGYIICRRDKSDPTRYWSTLIEAATSLPYPDFCIPFVTATLLASIYAPRNYQLGKCNPANILLYFAKQGIDCCFPTNPTIDLQNFNYVTNQTALIKTEP